MSGLTTIARKNAIANRSRFALTMAAVALSVAFLTATLILADSLTGTAESDIAAANAELDLVVEGALLSEGEGGPGEALERVTESIDAAMVDRLATVDGVASAAGVTEGFAKVVAGGEAVGSGTAADVGRGWIATPELNPFAIVDGAPPVGIDEVVLDSGLAADGGIVVGDEVEVITPTGLRDVTVVGLADYGPVDAQPLRRTVLFDADHVAAILDESRIGSVRATLEPGADLAAVTAAIEQAAAAPVEVVDAATVIEREQTAVASPFEFLSLFLIAFAAIATVAGVTIIVNTFSIAIAQRRRELALMRAVGATRRGVLRVVLGEAVLIAVVATAAGLAAGVAGAGALRSVMDLAGLSFIDGGLVITVPTLVIGATVGLVVAVGSAWVPARAAAAAAPVEALREATTEAPTVGRFRTLLGLIALAVGAGSLIGAAGAANSLLLVGAVWLVPGLILSGPALMSAVAWAVRPVTERWFGVQGSMASTNVTRNPRRSASTTLGLTLGVSMIAFFTIIASSLSASLSTSLDRSLQADVVVTSVTTEAATIDPTLVDRIAALDGVDQAAAYNLAEGSTGDAAEMVIAGIDDGMSELFDFVVVDGSLDDLAGGVAVWSGAEGETPAVGDVLDIMLVDGVVSLPVVAVFDESIGGFDAATHLVDESTLADVASGLLDSAIFVSTSSDGAADQIRSEVEATPGSLFETRSSYLASTGSEVDAIRNLVYALLGLTAVIAVVGVANTTALSISERVREFGLLRAVGTTQRGVRQIIRVEAAVLSAVGSVLGAAVAVLGAWALIRSVGGSDLQTVSIPPVPIVIITSMAIVAGIVAAAVPGWRASRLDTLDAIAGR